MTAVQTRIDELRRRSTTTTTSTTSRRKPEISDREFDRLLDELQAARSRASRAGHARQPDAARRRPADRGLRHASRHRVPMLSIDNTYSAAELREFDKRVRKLLHGEPVRYVVELKIDGVAISLDL